MARVEIERIVKTYGSVRALDEVDLTIDSGEFFTLLGPSGCGKTTLLRTVAGFNAHDSGRILVDGTRIDDVAAHKRDMGMVYQDYAIFPHMTVAENVGFGLATRNRPQPEIAERVAKVLDLVQLGALAGRLPQALSGGQQQRVALARAMVINPRILLMDEPLSNLDAKLRIELREDIRDLQRSLGITTIYVTHDQEEALVVSDRICVMYQGRVHQVAPPPVVYATPATLFVASFVGAMNLFADLPVGAGGEVAVAGSALHIPALDGRRSVTLGIRPEDVTLGAAPDVRPAFRVQTNVTRASFAGRELLMRLAAADGTALAANTYRPDPGDMVAAGHATAANLPLHRLHAFDPETGARIGLGA